MKFFLGGEGRRVAKSSGERFDATTIKSQYIRVLNRPSWGKRAETKSSLFQNY